MYSRVFSRISACPTLFGSLENVMAVMARMATPSPTYARCGGGKPAALQLRYLRD
nr:MAG TPA: hypothetical protein [Caudoviricetes sp.]